MAKIYKMMGIEFQDNPDMMNAYPLKIEKVGFCSGAYDNGKTDGLYLELRKPVDNKLYHYGLVGGGAFHNLHDEFIIDMKADNFNDLVGKYVIGRLSEDKSKLEDLMIDED